ncbi:MAG: DinB family protein [Gemmatimonadaceae bacterium]
MTSTAVATPGAIRPATDEYLAYYSRYIQRVPDGDILSTLSNQIGETLGLLRGLSESAATYRYAPDKWSVNEMVGHVIDTEKIFSYRALRFARGDKTPVPGYEQDDYVRNSSFNSYPLSELASELETVRRSTLYFFRHLEDEAWARRGLANNAEVSVRALAYIIAGHELHHREMLRTRYL